jgi:hypothetical protein
MFFQLNSNRDTKLGKWNKNWMRGQLSYNSTLQKFW